MTTIYESSFIAQLIRHDAQVDSIWFFPESEEGTNRYAVFLEWTEDVRVSIPWETAPTQLWKRDGGITEAGQKWLEEQEKSHERDKN